MTAHAVIVVGNERRFVDDANALARYLRTEAGCAVATLRGAYRTPDQLHASLRRAIRKARGKPLLVAYFGHGMRDHWSYALEHQRKPLAYPFKRLAALLAEHGGPMAIVNDTCHADGLRPFLEKAGVASRCLLIAACPAEDVSYGGLTAEVMARWARREVFEPIHERDELCIIEDFRYVPPFKTRARDFVADLLIRLRNLFRPRKRRVPPPIRLHFPPNGWGTRTEVTESVIGVRWGSTLDHLFFPKP